MTMLRYNIQTGANGSIVIPTTPFAIGEEVEVLLLEKHRDSPPLDDDWQPDPAAVRRFRESWESLPAIETTDEEIDQLREERLQKIVAEHSRIADQTPEEWQTAVDDFMSSWKDCLKGVPHMTAKEIRAERLEKKYGQRGGNE